jgi:hypothetical protein
MTGDDWIGGISGKALNFDGDDDRVDCGNAAPLDDIGSGDFSLSFWMKSGPTIENYGRLFSKYIDSGNYIFLSSYGTNDRFNFQMNKTGSANVGGAFAGTPASFDEAWHHIAITVDRTADLILLYIDGFKNATEHDISALGSDDMSLVANVSWGAHHNGTIAYLGALDECRVYDRVLTKSEITFLYNNPASGECNYSGLQDWCDQTYARCLDLTNQNNFGGFRFLPYIMEKEIWWGGPKPTD